MYLTLFDLYISLSSLSLYSFQTTTLLDNEKYIVKQSVT